MDKEACKQEGTRSAVTVHLLQFDVSLIGFKFLMRQQASKESHFDLPL